MSIANQIFTFLIPIGLVNFVVAILKVLDSDFDLQIMISFTMSIATQIFSFLIPIGLVNFVVAILKSL